MNIKLTIYRTPTDSFAWNFAGYKFDIGRNPDSKLSIDGESSHLVSWRHAEIELHADDGVVTDLGSTNGTFVNGIRIQSPTRIRPGDELWLGDRGPRIRVLSIGGPPAGMVAGGNARPSPAAQQPAFQQPVSPPQPAVAPPTPPSGGSIDPTVQLLVEMNRSQRQTTMMIVSIVVLFLFVLVAAGGVAFWMTRPKAKEAVVVETTPSKKSIPKVEEPTNPPPPAQQPAPKPVPPVEKSPPVVPPPPQDPWQVAQASLSESLFLVVVEEPKSGAMWALANAVAINNTRLLTTGVIGIELAKFQKQGHNLYLIRKSLTERVPIASILVFAGAQNENPNEQIFFDLAMLVAAQPLSGKPATLATTAELSALENGLPLASVAIDFGEDPLDRFQRLEPQLLVNKVFAITRLKEEPGAPQLALLKGKFTNKPIGCPVINEQGHVIGLVVDSSKPDANGAQVQVFYMPIVAPDLINVGATGQPNQVWIPPVVPNPTLTKKK